MRALANIQARAEEAQSATETDIVTILVNYGPALQQTARALDALNLLDTMRMTDFARLTAQLDDARSDVTRLQARVDHLEAAHVRLLARLGFTAPEAPEPEVEALRRWHGL